MRLLFTDNHLPLLKTPQKWRINNVSITLEGPLHYQVPEQSWLNDPLAMVSKWHQKARPPVLRVLHSMFQQHTGRPFKTYSVKTNTKSIYITNSACVVRWNCYRKMLSDMKVPRCSQRCNLRIQQPSPAVFLSLFSRIKAVHRDGSCSGGWQLCRGTAAPRGPVSRRGTAGTGQNELAQTFPNQHQFDAVPRGKGSPRQSTEGQRDLPFQLTQLCSSPAGIRGNCRVQNHLSWIKSNRTKLAG